MSQLEVINIFLIEPLFPSFYFFYRFFFRLTIFYMNIFSRKKFYKVVTYIFSNFGRVMQRGLLEVEMDLLNGMQLEVCLVKMHR